MPEKIPYQPSQEEIKKAEEMMTPEQKEMSEQREREFYETRPISNELNFNKISKFHFNIPIDNFSQVKHPTVSPDGTQVAYIGREKGYSIFDKECLMVGNKEGPKFLSIMYPSFSPDGKRIAYAVAQDDKLWSIAVDNEKGPSFDAVKKPVFSPDGKHLAYAAMEKKTADIIIDNERIHGGDDIGNPIFSADSKKIAFRVNNRESSYILMGNINNLKQLICYRRFHKPGAFGNIEVCDPVFSPDGENVAYAIKESRHFAGTYGYIMINDKISSPKFYDVGRPTFSPDGKKIAYAVKDEKEGEEEKRGKLGRWAEAKWFMMIGNKKGPQFDEIYTNPVFSPDGETVAYVAKKIAEKEGKEGKTIVMIGEKEYPYRKTQISPLVFSPDGKQVAYATISESGTISWEILKIE